MSTEQPDGVHISAGHVANLREYIARADELLAEACAHPDRIDELLRARDGVLTEMAGYLEGCLGDAR